MERDEGSDLELVLWRLSCGASAAGQASVGQIPTSSTVNQALEGMIGTKR